MRQFKARREPRSGTKTFFEHGRDEYLAAKVPAWVEPRRFCNALDEIHAPLGPLYKRSGYPWITLVLGSGCLEAGHDISGTRIRDVPAIVQGLLADADPLPDGTNAAKLAGAFAASLIADRLGPPGPRDDGDDGEAAAVSMGGARRFVYSVGGTRAHLLATTARGGVYQSFDDGLTWSGVTGGPPRRRAARGGC